MHVADLNVFKSFLRLTALVILGLFFFVAASAQETDSASDDPTVAEEAEAVSLPDPVVLKRLQSFRGPYTTPLLSSDESRSARATSTADATNTSVLETSSTSSVKADIDACRPPHCRYDETRVVLKLSGGLTSAKLAQARTAAGSSTLDAASLVPVFPAQAVASANARMARTAAPTPSNSRGGRVDLSRWYEMTVPAGADVAELIQELDLDERVEIAEPVFERGISGEPSGGSTLSAIDANDPKKPDQWHLASTRVEEAWQWLEDNGYEPWGDRSIVVAVIDSGVDYTHEDLAGNMWTNGGEIPDNNIDDDNNGFVDDVYGVSVVGSTFDHNGDPQDDNGHGTHVAGIIAAQGNNSLGVIGVAPNVRIMAIKAAQYSGVLTSTDISEAILYAYQQGADVINMSFGGSGRSVLEEEALAVAFGNAALIAAAGNNGIYNDLNCGPFARPSYPAAYPYVLGVMAEQPSAAGNGDWLAGFSNWDCKAQNGLEYEVMAPGVDIWSTTPQNGYAAWDGTSMAAPVVAGMAALLRTHFSDKSVYSSRFIMGQLGATGAFKQGITPCQTCLPVSFRSADTLTALTEVPTPKLAYLEHWLWDGSAQSASNDDDGIVDAGETIELAIVIKNYWGMADNVTVTLSAQADGAFQPDPYVTFEADSVNYGGVGSFAQDDNGLVYDEGGLVTGVNVPFRFSVAADTPNEHLIPLRVTMTASNGLDPNDATTYTTTSFFYLMVQRGRELPSVIGSDAAGTPGGNIDTDGVEDGVVTLDDQSLWLIDKPVLIESGAHLKVGPGATLQFWGTQPDDTYAIFRNSYIQNEGTLEIAGSAENPAVLKPSDLFPNRAVMILNKGAADASYVRLFNPWIPNYFYDGNTSFYVNPFAGFDHAYVGRLSIDSPLHFHRYESGSWQKTYGATLIHASQVSASRFYRLGMEYQYTKEDGPIYTSNQVGNFFQQTPEITQSLIDNVYFNQSFRSVSDSVFLANQQRWVNRYGDYVSPGSAMELSSEMVVSEPYVVGNVLNYEGKTYARLWAAEANVGAVRAAAELSQAMAASVGGHLFVPSNDAEYQAVRDWANTEYYASDTEAERVTLIPECEQVPEICGSYRGNYSVIGLVPDAEGNYVWITGEAPTLSINPQSDPDMALIGPDSAPFAIVETYDLYDLRSNTYGPTATGMILELPGSLSKEEVQALATSFSASYEPESFKDNAVLNQWWDPSPHRWLKLESISRRPTTSFFKSKQSVAGNYWGGVSEAVIDNALLGYEQDFNRIPLAVTPMLEVPPETAYPFVVAAEVLDADGNPRSDNRFAAEPTVWRVTFNRDMDATVQPSVSFGPEEPYTDFTVGGDWLDARTWQGNLTISPVATDGYQYIRVAGAVAADDPWLVTGDDKRRFRFEVITSGTESLNLQATGGEGYVDLSWSQDEYDTLQGFNIYRSTAADSGFIRINQTLVGNGDRDYRDDSVEPGVQYFYYFSVVLDGTESEPSNTASATPIDTVAPVLTHAAISSAAFGSTVLIQANVTDNISVESVTLFYRELGATPFQSVAMLNSSGSTYQASIPADVMAPPGAEYYIAATDGASTSYSGRESNPHQITVIDAPVLTSVSPTAGSSTGGDLLTLSGTNFSAGMTVSLGGGACEQVTVVSSSRATCSTPAHIPDVVSITVTNTQGNSDTLTNAFTYVGNATTLALPDVIGTTGQTIEVPLSIGAVAGLTSFFANISWDTGHLELLRVVKGPLIPGWDMTYAEPSSGQVNIAASTASNLAGSGTLVILEFNVLASEAGSSAISLLSARLNDEAIAATLANGSFSFFEGFTLSGSARFWDPSQTPIVATLTMDGARAASSSDSTGAFSFDGVSAGQHVITPAKDDGINASIRALDASLILSHVVGTSTLSGHALTAADVNANGQVTEQDAAKVLEVAAGLRTLPFENQLSPWRFSPGERRLDDVSADIDNLDFVGVFMGDVSGNWATIGLSGGSSLELVLVEEVGNTVTIDVFATPTSASGAVSAVELTLNTTTGATLTDVVMGAALTDWTSPTITQGSNSYYLATYSDVSRAFSSKTKVFSLKFSVADVRQKITQISGWLNESAFADSTDFLLAAPRDSDGDGVNDADDAFPDDPAASVDTDGDGMPDDWNDGYTAADSTTSLTLDNDDDNDGYTDAEEAEAGSDPLDANDEPLNTGLPVWLLYQATQ